VTMNGTRLDFRDDPEWEQNGNDVAYEEHVLRPHHDFGYSPTSYSGGERGEIGGIIFRDERPAYYAADAGRLSLDDELYASGKIAFLAAGSDSGVSLGWFDSASKQAKTTPEHESPQPNVLGITIEGPSRVGHYFRATYRDSSGLGADPHADPQTGKERPVIRPDGQVHEWSLRYDPQAGESGRMTVRLGDTEHTLDLAPQCREQGATFDRFGLFNMQAGGHHVQLYIDDLKYTVRKE